MIDVGIHPVAFDPPRWATPPPLITDGVLGYTAECLGAFWVTLIVAEPPGEGHGGRYLDSLTQDEIIVVEPNPHLSGMLERRGFKGTYVETPLGEIVRAHVRSSSW